MHYAAYRGSGFQIALMTDLSRSLSMSQRMAVSF
jgi:hypothetical protein